jgi:hypothetical protein
MIKPKLLARLVLLLTLAPLPVSVGCSSEQKTQAEVEELRKENMKRVESFRRHGPRSSNGN